MLETKHIQVITELESMNSNNLIQAKLPQVCDIFRIPGTQASFEEIKVGNVNSTYKVTYLQPDGEEKSYILQEINTYVFKNPVQVMENIDKVTGHIQRKHPEKTSLHFHHTDEGKNYFFEGNHFWRLFNYIPSDTYNVTTDLEVVHSAGEAFGEFQVMLGDFDASWLHETIPDFHDTRKRYEKLMAVVQEDPLGRAAEVRTELDWLFSVQEQAWRLMDMYR